MAEEKAGFTPSNANSNWNYNCPSDEEGNPVTNQMVAVTSGNNPSSMTTDGSVTSPPGPSTTPDGSAITTDGKVPIQGKIRPNIHGYVEPRREYNFEWIVGMRPEIIAASAVLRNEFRKYIDMVINDIRLLYAMARVGKEDTVALVNIASGEELVVIQQTLDHLWGRREEIGGGPYKFDIPARARVKAAELEADMAELLPGQVLPARDGKAVLDAIDKIFDVMVGIVNHADKVIKDNQNEARLATKEKNDSKMQMEHFEKELGDALDKIGLANTKDKRIKDLEKQVKKLSKDLNLSKQNLALANSKINFLETKVLELQEEEKGDKGLEGKYNKLKEETDSLLAVIIGRCPEDGVKNLKQAKELLKKRLSSKFKQTDLSIKLNNQIMDLEKQLSQANAKNGRLQNAYDRRTKQWSTEKSKTNSMIKRSLKALGSGLIPTTSISEPNIRERFNKETDNFQYRWFLIGKSRKELIQRNIVLKNDLGRAMTAVYAEDTVDPEEFVPISTDERAAAAQFGNGSFNNPHTGINGITTNLVPSDTWHGVYGGNSGYGGFYAPRGRGNNYGSGRGRGRGYDVNHSNVKPNQDGDNKE